MILGPDGQPLVVYERRALGFIDRTLPAESETEPCTGVAPVPPDPDKWWREDRDAITIVYKGGKE